MNDIVYTRRVLPTVSGVVGFVAACAGAYVLVARENPWGYVLGGATVLVVLGWIRIVITRTRLVLALDGIRIERPGFKRDIRWDQVVACEVDEEDWNLKVNWQPDTGVAEWLEVMPDAGMPINVIRDDILERAARLGRRLDPQVELPKPPMVDE